MSDHVFISYRHTESVYAQLLALELDRAGYGYWWDDNLEAGTNWSASIDEQIRGALALILLLSPDAQASEYVTYEWSFALGAQIPVLPVLIKPLDKPIHPRLGSIQYIDMSGSLKPDFSKVMERLQSLREQRAAAAQPIIETAAESETVAQMDRGREEYHRKNMPRALQLYEQALSSAKDSIKPDVCAQMAYLLCKSGDLDRVEKLIGEALGLHPDFADALAVRGLSASLRARSIKDDDLKSRKLMTDAQGSLLDALSAQPNLLDLDDESWWGTLGGVYRRVGDTHAAIDAYEHARSVTPESSYPLSNLALLYAQAGQADKMKQTYRNVERVGRKTVDQSPLDHWAYSDLILAEVALGKYEDGTVYLGDLIDILRPDVAANVLSSLLEALRNLAAALPDGEKAQIQPFIDQIQTRVEGKQNP
jgi:tetratricopeptide (TPR) repeat protein